MKRELVDQVAPPIYGALDLLVIVGPAVAVMVAADRGGIGDTQGLDLVVASALIGCIHAVVAGRRLASEERVAVRRADMWIAAVDALVVLALGATLLIIAVLLGFSEEHASLADRGYPVVALWAGLQVVAVIVAEVVSRFVFWWLEPHPRRTLHLRWAKRDTANRP
ncbi:MAG: hypothetical protein M3N28_05085 [Actinomycetota bacterium]|nr:hypothetical protein [Actinomycetota bacterium]